MQINIAILTHNAIDYTRKCIASLSSHTRVPHMLFVMDNGSTDNTVAWLSGQIAPNLQIAVNRANVGVPRGRNLMVKMILPGLNGDELVVFLDNDVEVQAKWCEPFLKLFATHPRAGIAGVVGHPILVHAERRELLPGPTDGPSAVDVVSGFCFWVRVKTLQDVGLFDEDLGEFWHEDDDYCVRAINEGYEVFAVPNAPIVHHCHKSGVAARSDSVMNSAKNQCYLASKWRQLGIVDASGRIVRHTTEGR